MSETSPPSTGYPAEWHAHDGVPLLHALATAIIQLADTTALESFTLPYPDEAQRALDRTVLNCLLRDAQPPSSLAELLLWCQERPLEDWPLDLPVDAVGAGDVLIDRDTGKPTQLCHEWWVRGRDSAAAHYDREIIHSAVRVCREHEAPESYSAFRSLLVNRPVLTRAESFEITTDLYLDPVRSLIERSYQPVPDGYSRNGEYATCGRCLTLLTPAVDGSWWCERDSCRRRGEPPVGRVITAEEATGLLHIVRPLRQFITGPGRAEMELKDKLENLRLPVEMWPGYDAYDLRVTFPDAWVWAIDVKDWAHPGLLGQSAKPVPADPPYDEAFWAIPHRRLEDRHDYLDVYARNRPASARDVPLRTDRHIVSAARARLSGKTPRS